MSGRPEDDDELEELRRQRLEELKEQQETGGGDDQAVEAQREAAEAQKEAMLRQYLTDGARKRLNTVRMSKPDRADRIEQQVLALAQSGRIQGRIDEEQMKQLLQELSPDSKRFNIKRRG